MYANDRTSWDAQQAENKSTLVIEHALALKIGAVNATKTDGGPDYEVSEENLKLIKEKYTEVTTSYSAKRMMNESLTTDELNTLGLIRAGYSYFEAVDTSLGIIIAAGDVTNPVSSDPRWPVLGV